MKQKGRLFQQPTLFIYPTVNRPFSRIKPMAFVNTTKTAPFGAITTYRAIKVLEAAKTSFITWNAKRTTYKQLSALSMRELDDIGMTRADVNNLNTGFFNF